jgi:integrase
MAVYRRGEKWVADIAIGGREGTRKRKTLPSKRLAIAYEQDVRLKELKGELGVDDRQIISLSGFVSKYRKLCSVTKTVSTQERDEYTFQHLIEYFKGSTLIHRIRREHVEGYISARLESVAPSTTNRELDLLKSLMNRAESLGYLKSSPAKGVKKIPTQSTEPRFLNAEQGGMLIGSASGQMKTFILFGLCAGLRKSEIFNLKWEDIDSDRRELVVRITKGKRSRRIPLSDELEEALKLHPRHRSSDFVIHNTDGSQWKDVRKGFEATLGRAGLPRMRIHDMRHSFISNLVSAGVDLHTVKELAGHRDIRTTLKYSHLAPGQKRDSIDRMNWGQ